MVHGIGHRRAQRHLPRFFPDPAHDQDVVVLAERHQEHEQQERQHEVEPGVAGRALEDQDRDAQRGEIAQDHGGHQVQGGDHAAQHEAEEQREQHGHDGQDLLEVAVGYAAHVVRSRRKSGDTTVDGPDAVLHAGHRAAHAGDGVQGRGRRRRPGLEGGVELHRRAVRADELRRRPVRGILLRRDGAVRRRRRGQLAGRPEFLVQALQLLGADRRAVRVEQAVDGSEDRVAAEVVLGLLNGRQIRPDRRLVHEQDDGGVGDRDRVVAVDGGGAGRRVTARRAGTGAAEAAGGVGRRRDRQPSQEHGAEHERDHRMRDHAVGQARPRSLARGLADRGRPEHRAAEHGEQRRGQRQRRQQHDRHPDRQCRAQPGVQAERGEQQAQQRHDDGPGRERDRLADVAGRALDRRARFGSAGQFLPHPQDQEQAVIGAGAEQQDDEHRLGDRGDLQAVPGQAADDVAGHLQDERRRAQRHDRGEHGAEHDDQHDQDDQVGQCLGALLRARLGVLVVHRGGQLTGQVTAEPGRQVGAADRGADRGHGRRRIRAGPQHVDDQQRLLRLPVRGQALVGYRYDVIILRDAGLETGDG